MDPKSAIEVADGVWWVGRRLVDDEFQCHAYLLENGDDSVLLDPGSPLTIEDTLSKVAQVMDLDSVKYLVCHHPDPDIATALIPLSERLTRPDVVVVTEWRARALLRHYGHRFDYWLVEDHDWQLPLHAGRALEFQLTPYLHFPGAFMSYDTATRTLFSSDVFGGFVPDSDVLVSDDIDYVLTNARPFHQHYMPSTPLLQAGLARVRHRWPDIELIAPQHGHLIPSELVDAAFDGLAQIDCGVFALSDVDHDLSRLLRLAEARAQLTESLLTIADPTALVASLDAVLRHTGTARSAALYIDVPDDGWTEWRDGQRGAVTQPPLDARPLIELAGIPVAHLAIDTGQGDEQDSDELLRMLTDMADSIRPAVDQYLARAHDAHRIAAWRRASRTDPLTGLRNRRALDEEVPAGDYALLSLDLDFFKRVNDTFGHASGDEVLRRTATAIVSSVRDGDLVYRMGGEEFLVVLPRAAAELARQIAERIRCAVAALDLAGHAPEGRVTLSVGASASAGSPTADFEDILARADAALYASKDLGRDRVTVAGSR
jgi:diguanylate cyclase (GGDEF)-like protein